MLTQKQAQLLCEQHAVYEILEDQEEIELLKTHNPALLDAYYALDNIAVGIDPYGDGDEPSPF